MEPGTFITYGMILAVCGLLGGAWAIFKYFDGIEDKINKIIIILQFLEDKMIKNDDALAQHIKDHCFYINDVEKFLAKTTEFIERIKNKKEVRLDQEKITRALRSK